MSRRDIGVAFELMLRQWIGEGERLEEEKKEQERLEEEKKEIHDGWSRVEQLILDKIDKLKVNGRIPPESRAELKMLKTELLRVRKQQLHDEMDEVSKGQQRK